MNRTVRTAAVTAALAGSAALALAAPAHAAVVRAAGEVDRYPHTGAAVPPLAGAPEGATARVQSVRTGDGGTVVTLDVHGFEGLERYGAHAHLAPCGSHPAGLDAGGHYQHVDATEAGKPRTDPAYANPENEVWLDLATNPEGHGRAQAVVDWQFRPAPQGRSVIIHEKPTSPADGTAGKRVACLDVSF